MPVDYPHRGYFIDGIYLLPLHNSSLKFCPPLWLQMWVLDAITRCVLHCFLLPFILEFWLRGNNTRHKDPPHPQPASGL